MLFSIAKRKVMKIILNARRLKMPCKMAKAIPQDIRKPLAQIHIITQ